MKDQADKLRKQVKTNETTRRLPPRKSYHEARKQSVNWKINGPVLRIFLLVIGLALVLFFFSNGWYEKVKPTVSNDNQLQVSETTKTVITEINKHNERLTVNTYYKHTSLKSSTTEKQAQEGSSAEIDQQKEQTVEQNNEQEPDSTDKQNIKILYHTVKDNETLFSISKKYYGSREGEQYIKKWNQLDKNKVIKGQVLKIPIQINSAK